jgi:hypothetical protein
LTALTHLAYRVWQQYKCSADDYGVMPDDPSAIKAGNRRLQQETERAIRASLDRLVALDILHRFIDQGQPYLYCRVWQTHQQVRYPSKTFYPLPPPEELAQCDDKTRAFFCERCGNISAKVPEDSRSISVPPTRARPRNPNPLPNPNPHSHSLELRGEPERGGPLIAGPGRNVAVPGRVPLPGTLFGEFVAKLGGDEVSAADRVRAWANDVLGRYGESTIPGSADNFAFWRQRAAEELFGAAVPQTRQQRVSASNHALIQRALARGNES